MLAMTTGVFSVFFQTILEMALEAGLDFNGYVGNDN